MGGGGEGGEGGVRARIGIGANGLKERGGGGIFFTFFLF